MLGKLCSPGLVLWGEFFILLRAMRQQQLLSTRPPSKFRRSTDETNQIYPHCIRPHSPKPYWRDAAMELKDIRILVFAALMIALRVALKSLGIPIAADLKINIAFFINALGSHGLWSCGGYTGSSRIRHPGLSALPHRGIFFPFYFY